MPVPARRSASRLSSALLVAAVAAAAYVNTLPAQFTFDDAFAIVHNADVTDLSKPLRSIFRNDFWGQDLASPMSHKSYRPFATLSFRAQHWLASSLGRVRDAAEAEQAEGDGQQAQQGRLQASRRPARPFVFHLTNVAVHALVTALVYRLACQLVAARQLGASPLPVAAAVAHAAGTKGGVQASSSVGSGSGSGCGSGSGSRAGFAVSQANLEPLLAALLFAVHPVHTEAVAGIVGHAELLCAALSIPALLGYMAAADGRVSGLASHWWHVAAAVLLGWAAALSKEIGITIMGAMLCYDALVSPIAFQLQPPQLAGTACRQKRRHQQQGLVEKEKQQGLVPQASSSHSAKLASAAPTACLAGRDAMPAAAVAAAATELLLAAANSSSSELALASSVSVSAARRRGLKLKLQRMAVVVAAVLLYVGGRAWLAGDQLVRIYRRVENPIPFANSSLTRKLTTGYLHARYAGLLVAPLQLSADWSYACIEYVSSLSDPRNLATAALYAGLLAILLAAQPWQVLLEWAGYRNEAPSAAAHARRWRLAVTAGLLVGPFFPASNVLFYVGTFIGERLLYVPSIGYCILIAQPLAAALHPLLDRRMRGSYSTTGNSCSTAADGGGTARGRHAKLRSLCGAAALVLAAMLCSFTAKTVLRNLDWLDEERLFTAAQKVCWRSGKVQLNSGIIERRYEHMAKAESHFLLAQAADPVGFCEPQYHIALTLLNRNLTRAVEYLERGVACKYTAADSVKALNQIYLQLMERTPERSAAFTERWAAVLARPELQRFTEAATYFESAAAKAQTPVVAAMMLNRAQSLLQEAQPVAEGRTPDHPVRVPASRHQLDLLLRCLVARRPVILAMLHSGGNLQTRDVKQAAYCYLNTHGEECRQPMAVEPGAGVEDQAARSSTYHTALMHALQEGDVNDPWLQQEWGLMLVAAGRVQEALAHLEVAGHIFAAQLQPPSKGLQRGVVLDRQGRQAITEEEAAAAAVRAYQHARAAVEVLTAAPDGRLDPAARRRVLCQLLQQECGVAHQQVERSKPLQSDPQAHRTAAAAKLLSQCLAEGRALGCAALQFGDSGGSNRAGARPAAAKDEL